MQIPDQWLNANGKQQRINIIKSVYALFQAVHDAYVAAGRIVERIASGLQEFFELFAVKLQGQAKTDNRIHRRIRACQIFCLTASKHISEVRNSYGTRFK